jgi:rhodanese-related sulfurtransferase
MADQIENLSPGDVAALLRDKQAVLVDVREPVEYFADRIEGAVLFPLSTFDPFRLPKGRIVFQCGSGKRKQAGLPTTRG